MATKKNAAPNVDTNKIKVAEGVDGVTKDMTPSQVASAVITRGALVTHTMKAYSMAGDEVEVTDLLAELRTAGNEVVGNDLGRMERMLVNQAITLDTLFHNLAQRSHRQEYMKQMETYLRLALKAQAQSRATIEAIGMLKNPMPFIKQANIAQGHQQVNNGIPEHSAHIRAGAGNSESVRSKLLEADHGNYLDTGAQGKAVGADPAVETVGKVHRAAHP